ncbi:MAG: helicase RepA family protein [Anaeromicrobium sp.]|jgi:RecA-family ATPase|uniref:AAA family ATPase n=1 Tax=Anaeromicrobium sp. TaxID=1929132 RepID=UPI0025F9CABF|nr:AAA family ATPase [Anaeromicrobium sp.]MCT4592870.1 helicase RepA family protein [Anaeromicrobium sp.]
MNKNLETVTGKQLMEMELKQPRSIIDKIMPSGLHILAGSPKIGKSWLVLWLCQSIATGEDVWGFQTNKGTVLYLCLEDRLPRIKNRLMSITESGSDATAFATETLPLGGGLVEQIEDYILNNPDTLLIVIDTLQQIRSLGSDNMSYANDYKDISALKAISDKYDIAIVCVHHLRKMKDDDLFNMISGTMGLSGSADGSYVLVRDNRMASKATLYITGRDVADTEIRLEFDKVNCLWKLIEHDAFESFESDEPIIRAVCQYIKEEEQYRDTSTNLLKKLTEKGFKEDITPATLSKKLRVHADMLKEKFNIHIEFIRKSDKRILSICDGNDDNDSNIA